MKKLVQCTVATAMLISNIAQAEEGIKANLKGQYEFQTGYSKDNQKRDNNNLSAHHKDFAFNSTGNLSFDGSNTLETGFTYGAKLNIKLSAKNIRNNASYLYTMSDAAGRWEFGSGKSAYSTMKVAGVTNACGSQLWDIWMVPDVNKNVAYTMNFGNFLDPKTRSPDNEEYSRKITYYSPKLKHLQLGVSYVPDSSNTGYDSYNNPAYHNMARLKTAQGNDYKNSIKDGVALGLVYEPEINQDNSFKASVVGEKGQVKQPNNLQQESLKNLKTYTLGAEYQYKQFSVSAGYMNYLKSLTSPVTNPINRDTKLYTVTGRYVFANDMRTSLTHYNSNHQKNKLDATTLALEYVGMQGIRPYTEFTYFRANGKYKDNQGDLIKQSSKGSVLILGTKVSL